MTDELTHIETLEDYEAFQIRVENFMESEGINCLNIDPEEDQEPHFTWSRCECCKRPLGGVRYNCIGFNPTKHQVQGPYEVCPDCLFYIKYGQLDDLTMQKIKENEKKED